MIENPGAARRLPYLFVGGAAVYLVLLTAAPLLNGLWLSVTDAQLLNPTGGSFIGFQHYARLFGDPGFYHSLYVTLVYTAAVVAGSLLLGTVAAVLLNRSFPGRTAARTVLTMPWAVPTVAVSLIFVWIYNNDSGVLNRLVRALGFDAQGWLTDTSWALVAVTAASVWKVFPFVMLVVLAALQSVPDELYESSRVDGADALNTFRQIVFPYLLPMLRVAALLMTIWSLRRFDIVWLLTQGGPVEATNTVVISVYRESFINSDLGLSAAIGAVGLVLSTVVTVAHFALERRSKESEAW
ncbi:carbohydrate ABC transporter permease [Nonomuraea lactucae]|uniref:carbohydrate ABC transporter permease n=1 Tax=Nonomuraea lactucae TaxID=2249762 RepID=UPI0013B38E31|nr:sugar ABC transporter permease [Nonomuraea lactucae]